MQERGKPTDMQDDRDDTIGMTQREDVTDKQRVIAAVMPRRHLGGDGGVSVRQERRIAGVPVLRMDIFNRPSGEVTDQRFLAARQNIHAEVAGLQEKSVHARFLGDTDHA